MIQTDVGIGHAIRLKNSRFPFIVVMPQCRKEKVWSEPDMEAQALAALDASIKEFHGDRNRIYLSGLSMGGYGTWEIAATHPGRFAALVPICAGVRGPKDWPQLNVAVASDTKIADPYAEVARRVAHEIKNPLTPIQLSAERIARNFQLGVRTASDADRVGPADNHTSENGNGAHEFSDERREELARVVEECTTSITRERMSCTLPMGRSWNSRSRTDDDDAALMGRCARTSVD